MSKFSIFRRALAIAGVLAVACSSQVSAQQREIVITPDTDYFGGDIKTIKEISLNECSAACLADSNCSAFTYNENANWCFLKNKSDDPCRFVGATGGKVVARSPAPDPDKIAQRAEQLTFLRPHYLTDARRFAAQTARRPRVESSRKSLIEAANTAKDDGDIIALSDNFQNALRQDGNRAADWARFSRLLLSTKTDKWEHRVRARREATHAAITALTLTDDERVHGEALAMLAIALQRDSQWKPAILAFRQSLAARDVEWVRERLTKLEAERGFRIVDHSVESDAINPRACIQFSDPIARTSIRTGDYLQVSGPGDIATEAEDRQVCINGLRHGESYRVTVRAGLPASDGEVLKRNVDLDMFVRDRSPAVRFPGRAYILPKGDFAALPIISVNTDEIQAELLRIGDRALAREMGEGDFLKQLSGYDLENVRGKRGERVWQGTVRVKRELNRDITSTIAVGELTGDLQTGVYILSAKPAANLRDEYWRATATQWFIVSDIALTAISGPGGLDVFTRSISNTNAIDDAEIRLVAANDEILGVAKVDAMGRARLDPGLLNGTGGNAPSLIVAETPQGDYAFLDYTAAAFDLSDRGVDGRAAPGPVDVYAVADRGVYRPGETAHLSALVRDGDAQAIEDAPLTMIVKRPDGVEFDRYRLDDQGAGGHSHGLTLPQSAMRGQWRAAFYTDTKRPPLAELRFRVEDFLPERLDFDVTAAQGPLDPQDAGSAKIDARFLYGAPASGLRIEGETRVTGGQEIAAYPGYRFGLVDDVFSPMIEPLQSEVVTAEDGSASVPVPLPALETSSLVLSGELRLRLIDPAGRPVERKISRQLRTNTLRLGLKPQFDDAVEEGGNARFGIIAIDADGQRIALENAEWELSKRQTRFQWYNQDGEWRYEPIVTTNRVATGSASISDQDQVSIEAPVEWGGYRLTLRADGAIAASHDFDAGWYVTPRTEETPDLLRLTLDKPTYKVGENAKVHLEPRFAGKALVMVADDRLIDMKVVDVDTDGSVIDLPVTEDWGPGAYITAALYRPMDATAKRMPARALGIQWASVDPAAKKLDVSLKAPDVMRPRGEAAVEIAVANLPAGEKAFLTLSAIDLGILNITDHQKPDPGAHYFGQRRLGVEIRDVYGRLIDPFQGTPGKIRSGGDGGLSQFDLTPPPDDLVAFFSGVVEADDQGRAIIAVPVPDFNGSVRLDAMVWTKEAVGQASQEMIVRDPIVLTATGPRFLQPGDRSRLVLDIAHVEGDAGDIQVNVSSDGPQLAASAALAQSLNEGERKQLLVPVEANAVGDATATIILSGPGDLVVEKTITIPVRINEPPVARIVSRTITAGEILTVDAGLLDGLMPETVDVNLSVGGVDGLDVAGLVAMLERYPYGCTEQLTSRAMPLVYLDDVARTAGLSGDADAAEQVSVALPKILANQSANGGFSLWGGAATADLWLDAYVTDFLTRAAQKGYSVPKQALSSALDNLRNRLAYAPEFEEGGEGIAYAYYVLARSGKAAIGDLRYYAGAKLTNFATPLAKAQIAAALAHYGDDTRAAAVMRAAITDLDGDDDSGWRPDYGSPLRDIAAMTALAAETDLPGIDVAGLGQKAGALFAARRHSSTQEQVWLTMAAHALQKRLGSASIAVNGVEHDGSYAARLTGETLDSQAQTIANQSDRDLYARVSLFGVPAQAVPASGNGYAITRNYFDLQGKPVSPDNIALGTRLMVQVTVTSETEQAARLIINDPLPAGFEIDNPNLVSSGIETDNELLNETAHTEFRHDRFVAAVDRKAGAGAAFSLAYVIRAVSPGSFAHPAAQVEDMYRPDMRARTASGRINIAGPRR